MTVKSLCCTAAPLKLGDTENVFKKKKKYTLTAFESFFFYVVVKKQKPSTQMSSYIITGCLKYTVQSLTDLKN